MSVFAFIVNAFIQLGVYLKWNLADKIVCNYTQIVLMN